MESTLRGWIFDKCLVLHLCLLKINCVGNLERFPSQMTICDDVTHDDVILLLIYNFCNIGLFSRCFYKAIHKEFFCNIVLYTIYKIKSLESANLNIFCRWSGNWCQRYFSWSKKCMVFCIFRNFYYQLLHDNK